MEEIIAETGDSNRVMFAPADPCETTFQKFFTVFKGFVPLMRPAILKQPKQPSSSSPNVTITSEMPGARVPASHSTNKTPNGGPSYIVTKTDADVHQILDGDTLEPLALSTYGRMHPLLRGGALSGAHACTDPKNQDFYNYVSKLGGDMSYHVFRIRGSGPERGTVDVLAEIKDAPIAYVHSSGLTERYYILTIWQADVVG